MKKTISVITFLFVIGFINAQKRVESVSDLIGTYRWIGRNDTLILTIANDTTFLLDLPCPQIRSYIGNKCTGKFSYNRISNALILSCDTIGVPISLYLTPCSIQGEKFVFIVLNTDKLLLYYSDNVKLLVFKRIKVRDNAKNDIDMSIPIKLYATFVPYVFYANTIFIDFERLVEV